MEVTRTTINPSSFASVKLINHSLQYWEAVSCSQLKCATQLF